MARPRRRSAKTKERGQLLLGIALIAGVMVTFAGLAWAYFSSSRAPTLDKVSLCPLSGPHGNSIVLVDASDDLPAPAKRELSRLLMDVAEELPPYNLLDIRILDPANKGSRSLLARCNPGDGSGLSEWTANPTLARRRWVESFREPVDHAIQGSLAAATASTSPIMAAIQSVAIDRFTGRSSDGPRRLIIVSDMIEHGPEYSQYKGDLSYARYRSSLAYKRYSTDLHGADISIWYVQRLTRNQLDSAAHIRFWSDWIADNKGHLREAIKLQGAS